MTYNPQNDDEDNIPTQGLDDLEDSPEEVERRRNLQKENLQNARQKMQEQTDNLVERLLRFINGD